jgi:mannosyl-oligosaccharide alpha-1,2-mannosidase
MLGSDWLGMGLTIIDSLDTMLIMGLTDHFLRAKKWIQETFNTNKVCVIIQFLISFRFSSHVHSIAIL